MSLVEYARAVACGASCGLAFLVLVSVFPESLDLLVRAQSRLRYLVTRRKYPKKARLS